MLLCVPGKGFTNLSVSEDLKRLVKEQCDLLSPKPTPTEFVEACVSSIVELALTEKGKEVVPRAAWILREARAHSELKPKFSSAVAGGFEKQTSSIRAGLSALSKKSAGDPVQREQRAESDQTNPQIKSPILGTGKGPKKPPAS